MAVQDVILWVTAGAILLLILTVLLRVSDLGQRLAALPKDEADIVAMLQRIDADAGDLSRWSNNAEDRLRRIEDLMPTTLAQSAIRRYDAFPDLRGNLSRSVAVVDERGNGFVLTVLVNRDDNRFFLKGVTDGQGDEPLSPEENSAVEAAMHGYDPSHD